MKKLIPLDEHNNLQSTYHWDISNQTPVPNGIACPNCGSELLDTNPMVTLTSYPPKKNVNCSECEYVGYRIA